MLCGCFAKPSLNPSGTSIFPLLSEMRGLHKLVFFSCHIRGTALWCIKEARSAFRLSHQLSRQLQASHFLSVFPAIYSGIPPAISQKRYICTILTELHFAAADVAGNGNKHGNFMLASIIIITTTTITEDRKVYTSKCPTK